MITTPRSTCRSWARLLSALGLVLIGSVSARADYNSTVLADNPLAFYALNPGSDPAYDSPDLTGNGNDGYAYDLTPIQGPSPYITNAASFDGSTSYVDLDFGSNPGLLNFSGPITLEAWVNPSSTGEFGDVVAKGYDQNTYQEIVIRVNGPYGANYYGSSGSAGINGGTQATNWTYIVLTSDGTNCSMYINGGLASRTSDTSGSQNFSDDWVIGDGSSAGGGRYFSGGISEVALYDHGLTAAQIKTHYLMGLYGTTNLTARNLKWSPNSNSGIWDSAISTNWINTANSQETVFNFGDNALFDDTPGVPTTVTVNNSVSPATVTINSSTNSYTIQGTGAISGPGQLIKQGSSTLTVVTPNGSTASVLLEGGVTYAGNNCFDSAASITITNSATMDLGGGQLANNRPVTLSGLGVNGEGALINSYWDYPSESVNITLAGDTKFGGSARWDLAGGSQITGSHNLLVDWSAGAGYGQWNSVTIGASVPGIYVTNSSPLGMTGMDNSCQNPATLFTLGNGCQLVFYSGGFNGSVHLLSGSVVYVYNPNVNLTGSTLAFEDNSSLQTFYNSGTNYVTSAVMFNGVAHLVLGDHWMVYTNVLSGPGGFVLDYYNNPMVLEAANTYTGPTIIGSSGNSPLVALAGNGSISQSSLIFFGGNSATTLHLDASARSDQTFTLASGQTLGGIGAINGNLTVSAGATIAPGGTNTTIGITTGSNPTGAITANNSVTLNGATVLKLNGSGNNDQIATTGAINYGGTLNLVNISGSPLAGGNSFQIFSAGSYNGTFASISPATPGSGLTWNTSQLNTSGVITVMAPPQPVINSEILSGSNLIISGTNGSASGTFYVLTSTNVSLPISQWLKLSTNSFGANGNFSVTNAIPPGTKQQYYLIEQTQ